MLVLKNNPAASVNEFVNQFFNNDYLNRLEEGFKVVRPKANIQEMEAAYVIELLVPGFSKEDFSIEVLEDNLKVSSMAKQAKEVDQNEEENVDAKYIHQEFNIIAIERNFRLSQKIDSSNIGATYTNGILRIEVPIKKEALLKRTIQIK